MEVEKDHKLPFLDVLLCHVPDGSITTSVYRKPSFTGLYLRWDSFVPKPFKRGLINCLLYRAWRISSSYEIFHKEVQFVRTMLLSNGYPASFIDACVNKFVSGRVSQTLPKYGPAKKQIFISLPFCGTSSIKIKRQLKRTFNSVFPWIDLLVVFKPAFKLSSLCKLKDVLPLKSRSHVVYRVDCSECDQFYIGMTCRRLVDRLKEHASSDASALFRHSAQTGHIIDYETPRILAMDYTKSRLLIKETFKIKEFHSYKFLNGNFGPYELKLF